MSTGIQRVAEEIIDPRAAELLRRQADVVNQQQIDRCVGRALIEIWRRHAPRLVDPVTGKRENLFNILLAAHPPSVATKCDAGTSRRERLWRVKGLHYSCRQQPSFGGNRLWKQAHWRH